MGLIAIIGGFAMANYSLSCRVALVLDHRAVWNVDPFHQLPNGRLGAIDDPADASPIVTILEGKLRPMAIRYVAATSVSPWSRQVRPLKAPKPFTDLGRIMISIISCQGATHREHK
jgi:hypothetical protein